MVSQEVERYDSFISGTAGSGVSELSKWMNVYQIMTETTLLI